MLRYGVGWIGRPIIPKNGGSYKLVDKPQYSYKQTSISFFVNHGPQTLITLVLMILFEALGHVCDPRCLKLTILAFIGTPGLAQNGQFGVFC